MVPRLSVLALAGLAFLAACGTPQEQCINRSTREIRALQKLLDETEANLARGYAWEDYEVVHWERDICGTVTLTQPDGTVIEKPRFCMRPHSETEQRRVAIDPVSEARKRDGLIAKIKALTPQAEANIAACKIAYPE
jgi:hypothetical protein